MLKGNFIIVLSIFFLISCGGGGGDANTSVGQNPNSPNPSSDEWLIDSNFIQDGGPGKDGIPSLDFPNFISVNDNTQLFSDDLITVLKVGDITHGYPHRITNWHEVVNDSFNNEKMVMSYCPLTGSSIAWRIDSNTGDSEFGVSGLLYNSNLILYDRNTDSNWPQMLLFSAQGSKQGAEVDIVSSFETTWESYKNMYPEGLVLDFNTGFSRDYNLYPYGSFRTDDNLLFNVNNANDDRLQKKERVLGVRINETSKAYVVNDFAPDLEVRNDTIDGVPLVVAGSANGKYAVAYERQLTDTTILEFTPVFNQGAVVMTDNEGNMWDINGVAVSGARKDEQLINTFSYVAYWFAWTSFFPETSIAE